MRFLRIFIIFIFSVLCFSAVGQKNCKNYLEKKCGGFGPPFKYSGQSKSTLFEKGQKSSFHLVTYGGYEYNITICSHKKLKGIYFKILEDTPQKKVLYDSSVEGDGKYLEKQFFVAKTKKLIVEVGVPDGDLLPEEEDYDDRKGCVGVVVEYTRPQKTGFKK